MAAGVSRRRSRASAAGVPMTAVASSIRAMPACSSSVSWACFIRARNSGSGMWP
jgi:hypothetical protein